MWLLARLWLESKGALRAFCVIVVAGWIVSAIMFVVVFLTVGARNETLVRWFFSPYALMPVLVFAVLFGASNLMLNIARCARCSKLLFDHGQRTLSWGVQPDIRHHRAKTFFNSYRQGAVIQLAMSGELSCSWCGHKLGTTPDYIVKPPK